METEKLGRGNCPDCVWFNVPEGCNVDRDSSTCLLNKRPRDLIAFEKGDLNVDKN
jgi:hypothetical protein